MIASEEELNTLSFEDILGRAPERTLPDLEVRLEGLETFHSEELQELKNGALQARIDRFLSAD